MSVKVTTRVWQMNLPPHLKYVAIALADYAHDDGTEARPSQQTLAEKTGISVRQIRRNLADLVELNVIAIQRPAGRNRATCFRFTWGDIHDPSILKNGGTLNAFEGTPATQWGDTHDPLIIRTVIETSTSSNADEPNVTTNDDYRERLREARRALSRVRIHD